MLKAICNSPTAYRPTPNRTRIHLNPIWELCHALANPAALGVQQDYVPHMQGPFLEMLAQQNFSAYDLNLGRDRSVGSFILRLWIGTANFHEDQARVLKELDQSKPMAIEFERCRICHKLGTGLLQSWRSSCLTDSSRISSTL